LDCTLQDGGNSNSWNFENDFIQDYLVAMKAIGVDLVELGFRSINLKYGLKVLKIV
jgi:4-hydroxy 2-oxovalerate aldolase